MTTLVASTRNYFAELWRAWNNFWFTPTDPATLALSVLLLAGAALAAGLPPAWRAARTDPMATLRED